MKIYGIRVQTTSLTTHSTQGDAAVHHLLDRVWAGVDGVAAAAEVAALYPLTEQHLSPKRVSAALYKYAHEWTDCYANN